ncbi:MAG TPA: DegT/DnrJ/EryC1/StrS family aminotransferase [Campylobacterales bacterium]|nr:DegT/DnrJ/EryC1/StrS family aminotransferase [Campylobacterales bacterium]
MSGKKIRLSKSSIGEEEKEAVLKVLDKEFLGMGEEVMLFEEEIKAYLETDFDVVCVNTGTSALHLALEALDIKTGDEVLVPSLTYIASFQAISACGATPVSVEIDPNTLFIDMKDAKKRLTKNTKAIMPVHYASSAKGMDEVYKFAKEQTLRVIEDAAQAFGSQRNGKKVGTRGDILCFSFDGIKNITSGEGGAIVSGDKIVIQRAQDGRLLGVEKDTQKRYAGQRSWDFDVKHQGFRYHMSNIMAAIGREQLKKIDTIGSKRQSIVQYYIKALKDIKEVQILDFEFDQIISHIFVVKAKNRDALREHLINNNIECGVHYKPNHLLSRYSTDYSLAVTERIYEEILTLPCHVDLEIEDQMSVVKSIKEFYNE